MQSLVVLTLRPFSACVHAHAPPLPHICRYDRKPTSEEEAEAKKSGTKTCVGVLLLWALSAVTFRPPAGTTRTALNC